MVNQGKTFPGGVGGTSASAPVFAAIVALLNEARVQAGKPTMGLVNPFVYANPDVFTDVTVGSDKASCACCRVYTASLLRFHHPHPRMYDDDSSCTMCHL